MWNQYPVIHLLCAKLLCLESFVHLSKADSLTEIKEAWATEKKSNKTIGGSPGMGGAGIACVECLLG